MARMPVENGTRIGIVGAGNSGAGLHLPVLKKMPGVSVAWICDLNIARARNVAAKFEVPAAFSDLGQCPDVDAIVMTIPVGVRSEAIGVTLERRWNVLVEKPFAMSVASHRQFLDRANNAGIQVGVMAQRRAFHSTMVARKFLASGVLGSIRRLWAADAQPERRSGMDGEGWASWVTNPAIAGGGILADKGFHLIDHVFQVAQVHGLENLKATLDGVGGIDTEVRAVADVTVESGEVIPIAVRLTRSKDIRRGISIECDRGTIIVGNYPREPVILSTPDGSEVCHLDGDLRAARSGVAAVHLQWEAFLEQCRTQNPTLADAGSALLTTQFIEDAYERGVWND